MMNDEQEQTVMSALVLQGNFKAQMMHYGLSEVIADELSCDFMDAFMTSQLVRPDMKEIYLALAAI